MTVGGYLSGQYLIDINYNLLLYNDLYEYILFA